jgi:hypothetical protein
MRWEHSSLICKHSLVDARNLKLKADETSTHLNNTVNQLKISRQTQNANRSHTGCESGLGHFNQFRNVHASASAPCVANAASVAEAAAPLHRATPSAVVPLAGCDRAVPYSSRPTVRCRVLPSSLALRTPKWPHRRAYSGAPTVRPCQPAIC